jgi:predicted nucleotidyltransferase
MIEGVHETMRQLHRTLAKDDSLPIVFRGPVLLASGMLFQSLGYMETAERWYKIVQNIAFAAVVFRWSEGTSVPVALVVGHVSGFFLNGQLPVVLKNVGLLETPPELFTRWQRILALCGERARSVSAIGIYGSLSRDELSRSSDLDVRIVRRSGFLSAVEACFLSNVLRLAATITLFPLDIYVVSSAETLGRLRDDESVEVILDQDGVFQQE